MAHAGDTIWVLICAALVFFMQAGFLVFELGLVRAKNATMVALKNVGDWAVVSIAFFFVGFALMFGPSIDGWIGADFFAMANFEPLIAAPPEHAVEEGGARHLGWAFVVFQLAFCGTAATIVSGAMAERTGFRAYILFAVVLGGLIYPVFGHWAWGSLFLGPGNAGWLEELGFHDFAGSSVVHGVGAWASLVGVWCVGPRLGRYAADGSIQAMDSHSLGWSALGTLMLWFGWWGFNGGSALGMNSNVALIIFNTNLAAASAGVVGFLHAVYVQKGRNVEEKVLGSVLGGLVAVTACCDVVTPGGALVVGAVAACVHNMSHEWVVRTWRLDDVVGAVAVHGFCGVWGCLAVALLGRLPEGVGRGEQLMVQIIGVLACFAWVSLMSLVTLRILRPWVGLRVDAMHEIQGTSLSIEHEIPMSEETDAIIAIPTDDEDAMSDFMADVRAHVREGERGDTR